MCHVATCTAPAPVSSPVGSESVVANVGAPHLRQQAQLFVDIANLQCPHHNKNLKLEILAGSGESMPGSPAPLQSPVDGAGDRDPAVCATGSLEDGTRRCPAGP